MKYTGRCQDDFSVQGQAGPEAREVGPAQEAEGEAHLRLGVDARVILTRTLYTLYGESRMDYTGWCQNDFNIQSYLCQQPRRFDLGVENSRSARRWGTFIRSTTKLMGSGLECHAIARPRGLAPLS